MTSKDTIPPLSPETWESYYKENGSFGIACYLDSTERSIEAIDQIISKATDFIDLKNQLTEYIKDRQALLDSAPVEKWALSEKANHNSYRIFLTNTSLQYL